jgi:hypothetical protein
MVPEKYADLGFEITGFGARSKALKFDEKPVFIFKSNSAIDEEFLTHICDIHLKITEKRKKAISSLPACLSGGGNL